MPDIVIHPADLIYSRGIVTAESIAQELRERLVKEIARRRRKHSPSEIINLAREILATFEPILAENFLNTDLAAWLAGVDVVAKKLPPWTLEQFAATLGGKGPPPRFTFPSLFGADDDEPIIRFPLIEKAAALLQAKRIVSRDEFNLLDASARGRAFTITGDMSRDTLKTIHDALAEDVAEGTSLAGFKERLKERLDKSYLGPSHLETVYRTNVQAAFHDGHDNLASDPIVSSVFPYQEYLAIHDGRVRDDHLALETLGLDGTGIYRRDDPMWDLFLPPWDYSCRCGVNLLTKSAAARKGVTEAIKWIESGQPPAYPEWRWQAIPFRPPAGFGGRRRVAA